MSDSLISVIMSVCNGHKYIASSIKSILNQSYSQFEFIIIDDGSSDRSGEIISSFADEDPRIKCIHHENRGLVKSLNEGIDLARGKFIARMDADDISLPDRLMKQINYLRSNPCIDIVGGQARVIDEHDYEVGRVRKPVDTKMMTSYLNYGCPIIHPTYMVRTPVYWQLNGYRDFFAVEDLDFLLRAVEFGFTLANLPDDLLLYRRHHKGISASNARKQIKGTRLVFALRRARASGNIEPPCILKELRTRDPKVRSGWFEFWWKKRDRILGLRQKSARPAIYSFAVFLVSMMHPELALASYRSWQAARWLE